MTTCFLLVGLLFISCLSQAKEGAHPKKGPHEGGDQGTEGQQQGQVQSQGELLSEHVPSAEAGAPRHRHLFQGCGPYELIHQCLQAHRRPGIVPGALQPTLGHVIPGDPEDHAPTAA